MVRARGVEVVSSGDLVQQFEAAWTDEQLATHRAASESLYRIKDRAFAMASDAIARGRSLSEFELQQQMVQWFDEEGLVTDSPPVVAVGGNAGNPHYLPTADQCRAVVRGRSAAAGPLGKEAEPRARCLQTSRGSAVTSARVPDEVSRAFRRDRRRTRRGRPARGRGRAAMDGTARMGSRSRQPGAVLEGQATAIASCIAPATASARTSTETASTWTTTRRMTIGACCQARALPSSPGLYFETFGVRTEINVFRGEREAVVTGPRQSEIVTAACDYGLVAQ